MHYRPRRGAVEVVWNRVEGRRGRGRGRVDGGGAGGTCSGSCCGGRGGIVRRDPDAAEDNKMRAGGGRRLGLLDWPPGVKPVFLLKNLKNKKLNF